MAKYFNIKDFEKSNVAKRLGIDNSIRSEKIKNNIKIIMTQLDVIRDIAEEPIIISSGYRCKKLNKAVGGSKNSQHMFGYAADLKLTKDSKITLKELFEKIKDIIPYTQLILEEKGKAKWIHYGYKPHDVRMESMIFKNGVYQNVF